MKAGRWEPRPREAAPESEGRVVVTVTRQQVGLDQREVGKGPCRRVPLEFGEGTKFVSNRSRRRGHVDHPGERDRVGLEHVDLPGLPVLFEPLEDCLGIGCGAGSFVADRLTTNPDDVAAVQNERLVSVCEGTSLNQWSKTPNPRAIPLITGTCSGV